ncbi:MAG: M48 family metallopeptidase [Chloroflexi bacterium]|nr:M48 family metallopeptidase [Chloroflexota bacterium]
MSHQIMVGSATIEYEVIYSKRKTISIQVYPDGRVVVRAPIGVKQVKIEPFVLKRAAWVLKHQRHFQERPVARPTPRRYAEGETYHLLGRAYPLKIVEGRKEGAQLDEEFLTVRVANIVDTPRIAVLINRWYRIEAERIFAERLAACFPKVEWFGVEYPKLTIRDMKSRWGSCSAKKKISLNLKLVQMAEELIDYVVLHELCHLKELNHSPAFYALMDQALPDWRERRQRLNQAPVTV